MAAIVGFQKAGAIYGEVNPHVSLDLNEQAPAVHEDGQFYARDFTLYGTREPYRIATGNNLAIVGKLANSFFQDYYYRVHIDPAKINLATIASAQTRQVVVWNAWPNKTAHLQEIIASDTAGLEIAGQDAPYTFAPLEQQIYDITVGTSGPPNVNIEILWDFSDVPDPVPLVITGTRAIKFEIMPEVPVKERWEWLTDVIQAVDGSEQNIALRGEMPRVVNAFKSVFTTIEEVREFYAKLAAAYGRLFIAEYQYATRTNGAVASGSNFVPYDNTYTDIRAGEYILILGPLESALVQVLSLEPTGCILQANLPFDLPEQSIIVPGSASIISEDTSLDRYAVDDVAEVNITATLLRQRSTLIRTGSTLLLPTFLGLPICNKRALADELVRDAVSTGQISIDNDIGLPDIVTHWNYARVGGTRQFKVNRLQQPEEMDFWKALLSFARGRARRFWVPTYRRDLALAAPASDAATSLNILTTQYATSLYPLPTHRYVEIETESGIHRASVTGAVESAGNSSISINPGLPAGAGWQAIKRISFLLPVRLGSDSVEWSHYGLESLLDLSIRTDAP